MSRKHTVKLCSWNVNSLLNKLEGRTGRRGGSISLNSWLEIEEPDIVAFQETRLKPDHQKLDVDNYQGYHRVCKDMPGRGLSFLVHNSVRVLGEQKIGDMNYFFQVLDVNISGSSQKTSIVNIYIPAVNLPRNGQLHSVVLKMYNRLSDFTRERLSEGWGIIIMGDFNTHNSRFGDR